MPTLEHEAPTKVAPPDDSNSNTSGTNSNCPNEKRDSAQDATVPTIETTTATAAIATMTNSHQLHHQLERSLSTPSRLKTMSMSNDESSAQAAIKPSSPLRHSHRDKTHHHHHHKLQQDSEAAAAAYIQHRIINIGNQYDAPIDVIRSGGGGGGSTRNASTTATNTPTTIRSMHRHKSSSPLCSSSSSASDSAFSRSQITLGDSDVGSENSSTSGPPYPKASHRRTGSSDGLSSESEPPEEVDEPDVNVEIRASQLANDHFKIVWKNLSYRVPDKRLSRLMSSFHKLKNKWLQSEVEEQAEQEEKPCAVGQYNQNQKHNYPKLDASQDIKPNLLITQSLHHASEVTRASTIRSTTTTAGVGIENRTNRLTRQRKVIFSNLNGCVKSGQLTAILGPSGAGKTTFLKCLTNSITKGVSGSINICTNNGSKSTSQHLKLCIIPQKDYLFDNLTVMENLLFASRIKNTQNNLNHKDNVYRVANLLGLYPCLKLKTSRLSGGQYKRVSIAQELLSQPDILILDEPTSGLDSLTCFRTVSVLRELADMSQTGLLPPLAIVMTIHQPQIKIFNLFHHVYILSSLGQCVYEGRPEYLIDTVAERCKLLPPPDDQNPASFIIDLASEVYGNEPINQLIELQRENFLLIHSKLIGGSNYNGNIEIVSREDSSKFKQVAVLDCINLTGDLKRPIDPSADVEPISNYDNNRDNIDDIGHGTGERLYISEQLKKRNNDGNNFWLHTSLLIKRLWISMWRDSLLTTTRVTFHLIIPFVFYFVYSQKSGSANACPHVERELDIQDMVSDSNIKRLAIQHDELILTFENVSLFFLLLYSFSMCVLAVTALSFPLNMQILLKETTNGWYTMPRFVMAKTLADLPIELTMPMISVSIAYALTGQPSSYLCWRMLSVTAVMTLCSLISQTQGLLFGAYFMNNVQAAVFISQASTLPWIMLSGFTTRVSELPRILQWLSFGSIYRLGIESIVSVRYGFGMCPCDEELLKDTPPRITGIPDQLRSVMSYYMDMYSYAPQTTTLSPQSQIDQVIGATATSTNNQTDIFGKIASTLARANTYGADIITCDDVRPFIMSAREVNETTLPLFLSILLTVLIGLKILLFYVVRIRAS